MINMALSMSGKQSQLKASMNVYINHNMPITDVPLLILLHPHTQTAICLWIQTLYGSSEGAGCMDLMN